MTSKCCSTLNEFEKWNPALGRVLHSGNNNNKSPIPKDFSILIPQTWEDIRLHRKRNFLGVIKWRLLEGKHSWLSGCMQWNQQSPGKGREGSDTSKSYWLKSLRDRDLRMSCFCFWRWMKQSWKKGSNSF